jgi:hypothetical protein
MRRRGGTRQIKAGMAAPAKPTVREVQRGKDRNIPSVACNFIFPAGIVESQCLA